MSGSSLGIILGGFIPALLFGMAGIFQKASNQAGISLPIYVILSGLGAFFVGLVFFLTKSETVISLKSGFFAIGIGICWALGLALVAIAITTHHAPLSKLVPLYNMNTLVTVLLGLILFSEYKDINVLKLIAGTVFITIGGTLVASA